MISIISAIHNGLTFNKIFLESIRKYTVHPYELIIIDNDSTDGSREFFQAEGAVVIENKDNYSYPVCQNQGIRVAKGDYLFFLNNDLVLSPQWDDILIKTSEKHGIDVLSASGIENIGQHEATKRIQRKWKRIKNPMKLFGFGIANMKLMHRLMYGNWEKFCRNRFSQYGYQVVEGIVGNNVMMTRKAIELVGEWDERLQAADFDLFMRTKKRALEMNDIKPCHIALGGFIHHYIRMTSKYAVKYKPFADKDRLISLKDKWTSEELTELHPDKITSNL